jgi:hypothetical protein
LLATALVAFLACLLVDEIVQLPPIIRALPFIRGRALLHALRCCGIRPRLLAPLRAVLDVSLALWLPYGSLDMPLWPCSTPRRRIMVRRGNVRMERGTCGALSRLRKMWA